MSEQITEFKVDNKPVLVDGMRLKNSKYPFNKMKIGQSFYIPEGYEGISSVRSAAVSYGKRHNMKFSIIRDGDGYRCGRVK